METLSTKDIQSIIHQIKNIIDSNQDKLMELDSVMGDGDLGFTMTKAFAAANEEAGKSEEKIPGKITFAFGNGHCQNLSIYYGDACGDRIYERREIHRIL